MTERSANYTTFVIERTYPAEPAKVFGAWADGNAKSVWMDDPDFKSDGSDYEYDFRVGGHERFSGVGPEGVAYRYDATIYDIVPDQRIVYCYEMYLGQDRISVSVTTIVIEPAGLSTKLTYTEQGVFLDALDKPEMRQEGTEWLLDNLAKYLASHS